MQRRTSSVRSVADEGVAGADVEINVRQRLDAEIVAGRVRLDLGGEFEEQAQFADFHRLFHDVHRVEIIEDDGFQDEVAPVGVSVHAGEDFGEFLVVVGMGFAAVVAPFGQERFHAVETGFVEGFKDVERGKDERARAAGWVKDGDGGDGLPEGHEQVRAFAILDDILRELAEIQIEGDEVVDLADFACGEFLPDFS